MGAPKRTQKARRRSLVDAWPVFGIAVAIAALPAAAVARKHGAQQGPPAQKAVILDLIALDNRGEPVTDLLASDLQISDNGKRQEVVFFRPNHGKNRIAGPHEFSNRAHPSQPATVILFDLMNERTMTDAITRNELVHALEGQETGEGLYLYILTNRGNFIPIHPLPEPEAEAEAAENWTQRIRPLLDPVLSKIFSLRPIEDWDPGYRFQTTLQAISMLGGQMADVPGRKNLVWVTHGVPSMVPDLSGQPVDLSPQLHRFGTSLERAHIAVYAVDQSTKGAGADMTSLSTQTLQDVSQLTGGRNYVSDSVEVAINEARRDSRVFYTVGYFAPAPPENGKFHKIRVSSGRRGLHLNAERGYYAYADASSGEQEQATLTTAAQSPFDSPDIGLLAKVADPSHPMHLEVQIASEDLVFRQLGDEFEDSLVLLIFESNSEAPARTDGFATRPQAPMAVPIHLSMTPEQREKAIREGTGITRDIALASTTHQVRLVVLDQNSGRYGSLRVPIGTQH